MLSSEKGKIDIICSLILLVSSIYLFSHGTLSLSTYLTEQYIKTDIFPGKSSYVIQDKNEQIGILTLKYTHAETTVLEGSGALMLKNTPARLQLVLKANLLGQVTSGTMSISTETESYTVELDGISPIRMKTVLMTQERSWHSERSYPELLEIQTLNDSSIQISHNAVPRYLERAMRKLDLNIEKASSDSPAFSQSSSHITWKEIKKAFLMELTKDKQ